MRPPRQPAARRRAHVRLAPGSRSRVGGHGTVGTAAAADSLALASYSTKMYYDYEDGRGHYHVSDSDART